MDTGKLEYGETLEECLVREYKEELEIDIKVGEVFATTEYKYIDLKMSFTFFEAELIYGKLKLNVHNDVKRVLPEELKNYDFCPADVEVVKRLVYTYHINNRM